MTDYLDTIQFMIFNASPVYELNNFDQAAEKYTRLN